MNKVPDHRVTEHRRIKAVETLPTAQSLSQHLVSHIDGLIAIQGCLNELERAVKKAKDILTQYPEGRIIYAGAGTSGRLGTQDGVELIPTFRWPETRLAFLMAGGNEAYFRPQEGAEDNVIRAYEEVEELNIQKGDVVIGIAASGSTPYTTEAIKYARERGAMTIAIANNSQGSLLTEAEFKIAILSGAEHIPGSTRLSAGTSQKVALNILSTQIMIEMNKVYQSYMVDMLAMNDKLKERAVKMVMDITKQPEGQVREALKLTDDWVRPAILVALGMTKDEALESLAEHNNDLHKIVPHIAPHLV